MADAMRAVFSIANAAPFHGERQRTRHDRVSFYLPIGPQSAAGDHPALVVPQPVPRFTRPAAVPGIQRFVISERAG
jgi:hypothetical protein